MNSKYRIVYTFDGAFEDVVTAPTLAEAKRLATTLTLTAGVEYAEVYDRDDHVVFQAFAA